MAWLDALPLWISFPLGFVLLIVGAEWLVRGSARLALDLGVKPLIIGLTVVAFGTSAPELAVSIGASLTGESDVAVGNVVGSNIMNILLILGLSAVVAPLTVKSQLVRLDVPLMIAASIVVWVMALNGLIGRVEGLILVAALFGYLLILYLLSKRKGREEEELGVDLPMPDQDKPHSTAAQVMLVVVGVLALALGARWLVGGATTIAQWLNIPELVIGLTVVAVGTSLPEIATSVMASVRGQRDIAVGNVVGSNIFNLLCVLGFTAALPPAGVPVAQPAVYFDLPVMIAVAVVCLPIFFTGGRISRLEGGLLLAYFVAYNSFLLLKATEHALLGPFSVIMLAFAIPLTAVGILGSAAISLHRRHKGRRSALPATASTEERPGGSEPDNQ